MWLGLLDKCTTTLGIGHGFKSFCVINFMLSIKSVTFSTASVKLKIAYRFYYSYFKEKGYIYG